MGGKAICNIEIIDNGRETIIFDNFLSPEAAQQIPGTVQALELLPVRYIINSHYNNDHISGNKGFPEEVNILDPENTAELISYRESREIENKKEYTP